MNCTKARMKAPKRSNLHCRLSNITRIWFWGHFTITIRRNHQNSIGNHYGPLLHARSETQAEGKCAQMIALGRSAAHSAHFLLARPEHAARRSGQNGRNSTLLLELPAPATCQNHNSTVKDE